MRRRRKNPPLGEMPPLQRLFGFRDRVEEVEQSLDASDLERLLDALVDADEAERASAFLTVDICSDERSDSRAGDQVEPNFVLPETTQLMDGSGVVAWTNSDGNLFEFRTALERDSTWRCCRCPMTEGDI